MCGNISTREDSATLAWCSQQISLYLVLMLAHLVIVHPRLRTPCMPPPQGCGDDTLLPPPISPTTLITSICAVLSLLFCCVFHPWLVPTLALLPCRPSFLVLSILVLFCTPVFHSSIIFAIILMYSYVSPYLHMFCDNCPIMFFWFTLLASPGPPPPPCQPSFIACPIIYRYCVILCFHSPNHFDVIVVHKTKMYKTNFLCEFPEAAACSAAH